jgi:hypothetical protein
VPSEQVENFALPGARRLVIGETGVLAVALLFEIHTPSDALVSWMSLESASIGVHPWLNRSFSRANRYQTGVSFFPTRP